MQINAIEYLEHGALRTCPNKTAIIDGAARHTFAELERYAKRCATLLMERVPGIKTPIAVFLPKGGNTIISDLGIIYSGNIFTNLDVKSPAQRIKNILGQVQPAVIITSKALLATLTGHGIDEKQTVLIDEVFDDSVAIDRDGIDARLAKVIDTDPMCIINTSGSTGTPKSAVLPHRAIIDFMDWAFETLTLDGSEVMGALSPCYFDLYLLELCLMQARGATYVNVPDELAAFPPKLVAFLAENDISLIYWVPTIMVNIANLGLLEKADLSKVRKVFFAGEVFPTKHFNMWRRAAPQAQYVNMYGPIETTVECTYFIIDREFRDDEPLPIGFACRNTDILILNEQNQIAAVGEPGELCVRGSSLGLGYWNDPEKTAKAFVQNPLNKSYPEIIYRTGDTVSLNERGEIMFLGRKDFQIKHMGYRIELGEIEHIVNSSGLVANACVLYHKERKEITLFFEAKEPVQPAAIRQSLGAILPKYMLPTVFRQMDALPRNPNGKIDRNGLTAILLEKAT